MIKKRIIQYLDFKGFSKYEFYKKTSLSNGFLDKEGTIGADKCEIICYQYPDLNLLWLITGQGSMILNKALNDQVQEPQAVYHLRTDNTVSDQKIPLYDIEAAAGLIPLFETPNNFGTDEYIVIPRAPKCDGAVFVVGDSMYPLLKSGDIIAYKKINDFSSEIFWGEMYLVSIAMGDEEYISVKWVQKGDDAEHIRLVSENRHHQAKDVHLSKVRAMAMVKASIRINAMG